MCDANVGRPLHTLARGQAAVRAAQFSGDSSRIVATLGDGRSIRAWDLSAGRDLSRNAKSAREFTRRGGGGGASPAERLRVAEWFLLHGQPNWARQVVTQASPDGVDSRSQVAAARVLWSTGDRAGASNWFSAALAKTTSAFDQPYLTLCRDAAATVAGGGP